MPSKKPTRSPSRRGRGPAVNRPALTSSRTDRNAYEETRQWLLQRHGPVCAYCEVRQKPGTITLDHVTPRRGQTAYDRRDNLVLCCKACNTAKADKSIQAFLLGRRSRAISLFKYGQHLSDMLVEMARQMLPPGMPLPVAPSPPSTAASRGKRKTSAELLGPTDDDASPYQEDSPYSDG